MFCNILLKKERLEGQVLMPTNKKKEQGGVSPGICVHAACSVMLDSSHTRGL